jgi:hypothetical protein
MVLHYDVAFKHFGILEKCCDYHSSIEWTEHGSSKMKSEKAAIIDWFCGKNEILPATEREKSCLL